MSTESAEPYREFIEQMVRRLEGAGREVGRELAGMREDLRTASAGIRELMVGQDALRDESRAMQAESRAMQAEIKEAREETRAQTRALLMMLDRFDAGADPPAI